ncbi:UDP-N-acetylglucosamine 2-epimerase (hydrolyzing) [Azospirillum sp. B21]|uniref:UDP-N-acetylglucosamine 2-epimerase n=1 Tax=Azospirillum sp. B21 TaxID=2607496 RepID=UPI0011EECF5E|nr:UDP-N-acetylglucosamine 2-epimerase [Azospirillum sp. B21]KAA0577866.1 UDP-N-acetylglucosamine 2-epimerase (hydrolyzing) [Azospirillum sp. B21]
MPDVRRICVVTGSRADYGHLAPVMAAIRAEAGMALQVVATGMHLSPAHGLTHREIDDDGFAIDARVEMLLSSDTGVGVAKSVGLGIIGFADVLDRLRPDLLLVLGDRFETLAAAQAGMLARIPMAHIYGGDTTEGAYDEAIRHALTKMAHLHFTATTASRRRVIQLGEEPWRVHAVGSPSLDTLLRMERLPPERFWHEVKLGPRARNLLVTHHPVTLRPGESAAEFAQLLTALHGLGDEVGLLFTLPNADNEGRLLAGMVEEFVRDHPNAVAVASLGHRRYCSAIAAVDAVVGNSSSGLSEVPSFGKPTVNIGDRQKGRPRAASVIDVPPQADAIAAAIRQAFTLDTSGVVNPFGDGHAAERIVSVLREVPDFTALIRKPFHDLPPTATDDA